MLTFEHSEEALRTAAVAAPMQRDVVVADGPEAATYLHGQLSQNVERLAVGSSAWSLLLEPSGHITSWLRITRVAEHTYWLDTDPGAGETTLARLDRFKLRTKAEFELRGGVASLAVRGPQSPSTEVIQAANTEEPALAGVAIIDLDWPESNGVDLIGLDEAGQDAAVALLGSIGVPFGDPGVVELERIEAGRPVMGREIGEKTIPAETGVVDRSADFTKGCYVGQELVARVDSRGNNTPRTVHPVRLPSGMVPAPGDELFVDGGSVGVITSAIAAGDRVAALASIKRGFEAPSAATIEIGGQSVTADVAAVHWA